MYTHTNTQEWKREKEGGKEEEKEVGEGEGKVNKIFTSGGCGC